MIRTQIQLSEQQLRTLKTLAAKQNVSVAELIRQGVELLLRSTGAVDHAEQQRRALALAGRFRSEVNDLALEHDHYLDEAYQA